MSSEGARSRRWLAAVAAAGSAATLVFGGQLPVAADIVPPPQPLLEGPPAASWPPPPPVDVPVFLLVDVDTGQVLAARRADEPRPVASTIKILTALTVADRLELDEPVTVGDEVVGVEGASVDLEPGERWTVEQLLQGVLVRSGNDAAVAVATAVAGSPDAFVELMATTAREAGLRVGDGGVVLTSPSGLDDDQRLSARDLATLARILLDDPELAAIVSAPEVELPGVEEEENRNLLIGTYPGATGIKTGFTEAAGNSLVASAQRGDRELVAVVLGGGPDPERFEGATALLDHGFEAFEDRQLVGELTVLIAGGTRQVEVAPLDLVAPVGSEVELALEVAARPPERGPLSVPVLIDGDPVASVDALVSGEARVEVSPTAGLGRAVVDGTYAALRARHAASGTVPAS